MNIHPKMLRFVTSVASKHSQEFVPVCVLDHVSSTRNSLDARLGRAYSSARNYSFIRKYNDRTVCMAGWNPGVKFLAMKFHEISWNFSVHFQISRKSAKKFWKIYDYAGCKKAHFPCRGTWLRHDSKKYDLCIAWFCYLLNQAIDTQYMDPEVYSQFLLNARFVCPNSEIQKHHYSLLTDLSLSSCRFWQWVCS